MYADISALHDRPFQLYQSLMLVQGFGVWDTLLVESDYLFATVNASSAGLRALNGMVEATSLPRVDPGQTDALIQRDSLQILGLR